MLPITLVGSAIMTEHVAQGRPSPKEEGTRHGEDADCIYILCLQNLSVVCVMPVGLQRLVLAPIGRAGQAPLLLGPALVLSQEELKAHRETKEGQSVSIHAQDLPLVVEVAIAFRVLTSMFGRSLASCACSSTRRNTCW
jgi:hypothetical protein